VIVTRGLGAGGSLVAAGLGIVLSLVVLPPAEYSEVVYRSTGSGGGYDKGRKLDPKIDLKVRATFRLPELNTQAFIYGVLAKGGAQVALYDLETGSALQTLQAVGSAKAAALLVNSNSELGTVIAKGVQDLSDEEIAMLILATLDL
jgi:hypothetical protein